MTPTPTPTPGDGKEKPVVCHLCGESLAGVVSYATPEGHAHWHCITNRDQARQNQIIPLEP